MGLPSTMYHSSAPAYLTATSIKPPLRERIATSSSPVIAPTSAVIMPPVVESMVERASSSCVLKTIPPFLCAGVEHLLQRRLLVVIHTQGVLGLDLDPARRVVAPLVLIGRLPCRRVLVPLSPISGGLTESKTCGSLA